MTYSLASTEVLRKNLRMSDKLRTTVTIERSAGARSDGTGSSVRAEPEESAKLELVSTVELKKNLKTDDDVAKESLTAVRKLRTNLSTMK